MIKMIQFTLEELFHVYIWLDVPLHGQQCRDRNAFIKKIEPAHTEMREFRRITLEKYADKDTASKAIIENGLYKIADDKQKQVTDEIEVFGKKIIAIELEKPFLRSMKTILLEKVAKAFKIEEGKLYDSIVTKIETA